MERAAGRLRFPVDAFMRVCAERAAREVCRGTGLGAEIVCGGRVLYADRADAQAVVEMLNGDTPRQLYAVLPARDGNGWIVRMAGPFMEEMEARDKYAELTFTAAGSLALKRGLEGWYVLPEDHPGLWEGNG